MAEPLRTVGRYQLWEELGAGGFAAVYRAYDPTLDRVVAIKVLHGHLARDRELRARFVREGIALARVRHPNVVQIYDAGDTEDTAYLAMELIEGHSLDHLLNVHGPLPLEQVLLITDQIAGALAAVHDCQLIHRDIKPANILWDERRRRAVLLDLGIARVLDVSVATASGLLVGTPAFMAPEQIEPGGAVSPQTDVYQLGATVYALLSCRLPFAGTTTQVMYAVVHHPPPDLAEVRPDLPPGVVAVVAEALAKDPARRPPGTVVFAAQLRAMAGRPGAHAVRAEGTANRPPPGSLGAVSPPVSQTTWPTQPGPDARGAPAAAPRQPASSAMPGRPRAQGAQLGPAGPMQPRPNAMRAGEGMPTQASARSDGRRALALALGGVAAILLTGFALFQVLGGSGGRSSEQVSAVTPTVPPTPPGAPSPIVTASNSGPNPSLTPGPVAITPPPATATPAPSVTTTAIATATRIATPSLTAPGTPVRTTTAPPTLPATAQPTTLIGGVRGVEAVRVVRQFGAALCTAPSGEADIVVVAACGETLTVAGENDGWYQVYARARSLWVGKARVENASAPSRPDCTNATTFQINDVVLTQVAQGCLSLRRTPSRDAPYDHCVNNGHRYTIINGPVAAEGEDWFEVQSASTGSGWVLAQFLRPSR